MKSSADIRSTRENWTERLVLDTILEVLSKNSDSTDSWVTL